MKEWRYAVNLKTGAWSFSRTSLMITRYKRGGGAGRVNLNDALTLTIL